MKIKCNDWNIYEVKNDEIKYSHKLMCWDSTNQDEVEKLMNWEKADMVFTDPPYNIAYDFNNNWMVQSWQRTAKFWEIKNDNMSEDKFDKFITDVFSNLMNTLKDWCSYYITAWRESTITFNHILDKLWFHIQSWLIWVKENFNISRLDHHPKHEIITYWWKKWAKHRWFNNRSQTDVLEFKREVSKNVHPTQKPVELLEYLINNSSQKNEVILDLFWWSWSTLIASEKTNRKSRIMEIDEKYIQIILKRYNDYTNWKNIKCLNRKLDLKLIFS